MGGNALKTHKSIRLLKEEYNKVAQRCLSVLREKYPQGRFEAIPAYRDKEDFGDLDILYSLDGNEIKDGFDKNPNQPLVLAEALSALEVVRNGPVTSIGVKAREESQFLEGNVFQVDLIKESAANFDFALSYYSFNDLGNLVGRIAKAMQTTLRHDGLYYYFRDGDYKFREILLTSDFDEALGFMGLDASRYREGFDSLKEIFDYVRSSKYFNDSLYLLENRNAKDRMRDTKRTTYQKFLLYCKVNPIMGYLFPDRNASNEQASLQRIMGAFPSFGDAYEKAQNDLRELKEIKEKFSGAWVSMNMGLQGKELGALMQKFRMEFDSKESYNHYVKTTDNNEILIRLKIVNGA